ncbi:N-6 DNA methylase [Micromonospora haikouensis]|uniref:N-6 DNA methylase n=1 Tax=Micromonospora haikouensis TaxID=686309 RepID=UPI003425084C
MQENPTITAAEIARLAGVGRAAVSNWRKRHPDFPAPVGGTAASPEFDLPQVERWLREQGKLPEATPTERIWRHLAQSSSATATTAAALTALGEALLARKRGTRPAATRRNQAQSGQVPPDVAADLDALADQLGPEAAFDQLWQRFTASPPVRAHATPDDLADLMAALADVRGGSVLDPAAGTGSTLLAAARAGCAEAHGQEIADEVARLVALRLALGDVPGDVRPGDSLRADAYPGETFDAVLCHPPFGATRWGDGELGHDPRWIVGTTPRTEPELAWAQHALAHLRVGGHAVLLMPPAVAGRRAGRRIRVELLRRGHLRAVVALPAGAAAPHGVPLHLWVLRRAAADAPPPARALLVDAASCAPGELSARVLAAWRAFAADGDAEADQAGFARAVPVVELLDEEVDLTPARRQPAVEGEATGEQLVRTSARLAALVGDLPALMPRVTPAPDGTPEPTLTVGELARTGALELIGPFRATGAQEIPLAPGDVVVPMVARQLTPRVVTEGGELLARHHHLLRPNPAALDPWFLAGQLRTSANERQASSLSGTLRFDVRRAQVRRLPLEEQRALGEAFRRLDAFESTIRQAAELGAELVQLAADGLASGVVRPDQAGDAERTGR